LEDLACFYNLQPTDRLSPSHNNSTVQILERFTAKRITYRAPGQVFICHWRRV